MSTRVLSLALVLSATLPAHAGCLATPTIDVVYNSAPLAFRARVLQITPVPPPPPPPGLGSSGTDALPMDLHLRLQVLESSKGDPGTEITVLGGDPLFGKGGEFLALCIALSATVGGERLLTYRPCRQPPGRRRSRLAPALASPPHPPPRLLDKLPRLVSYTKVPFSNTHGIPALPDTLAPCAESSDTLAPILPSPSSSKACAAWSTAAMTRPASP